MSSLFQDMEEFTLFDGLVPSNELLDFGPVVEDKFDVGFEIPGDSLVKNEFGSDDLFQDLLSGGSLEENNWMETVDLSSLLETARPAVKPELKQTKSGRLLEELLTNPIKIKSSPTVSEIVKYDTTSQKDRKSPISFQLNDFEQTNSVSSLNIIDNDDNIEGLDTIFLQQQLQELYEATVSNDMDISHESISSEISLITTECSDKSMLDCSNEFIGSPLSSEDIDSILSTSQPASPSDSIENDPDYSPYISEDNSSKKSKKTRNNKSSSSKSRPSPYEKPTEKLDKKERKRIQNRNAAIRYREKKRAQKGTVHNEEDVLASRNKELKTKVEHLVNEIKYMKNLLVDVCEARGLKIEFK